MSTESNIQLTLGSLFDGSGGFPLGGLLTGCIAPLWSSEVEPFAIRVTTKRLPEVKHYGDVSAINGSDLPLVDKGAIWQKDKSATLGCNNDQTVFVPKCYGVCSKSSHSMMSDNPHSGFYEANTSRTLDRSGGDPTCNQGGLCICEPVVCVDQGGGKSNCTVDERVAPPLACTHGGAPAVAFKHNRTLDNPETQEQYFHRANLGNLCHAFSALYLLEKKYMKSVGRAEEYNRCQKSELFEREKPAIFVDENGYWCQYIDD